MDFDFDNISTLVKHADSGVKLAGKAVEVTKSIKNLLSSPKTSSNPELEALVVELMSEVTDTKLANVELKTQLLALKEAAIEAQAKANEFARYELWETPAGQTVYRLKEQTNHKEPMHYLCPTCKEKGVKSILQGHEEARQCTSCNVWFRFEKARVVAAAGSSNISNILDGYLL
ncbi:hypothetical protein [Pseudovibrio sp. Ad37]|uniref:hypothetical protein n=1 Tax=Pseudovibrio sp. Ad37 TaxID=989422 RepID=UPI0007AEA534|nr:hypothetical protein [Pseudovibrio sp. Ad37]KZL17332.1 hypothetical protein PsAD37_04042 [Pseudovibrio sp. Ad37]